MRGSKRSSLDGRGGAEGTLGSTVCASPLRPSCWSITRPTNPRPTPSARAIARPERPRPRSSTI